MHLDGMPPIDLGSVQDQIRLTVWYRREQRQILETLISLYSAVISINPEVSKKVESLIGDYIESVVPGSAKIGRQVANTTIKKQGEALQSIFESLKAHSQGQVSTKKK